MSRIPPAQSGTAGPRLVHEPHGQKRIVRHGTELPHGIRLLPDQSLLYVAESRSHWVWSYQIQEDGSLADKQRYFHLHVPDRADNSGVDGIRVDRGSPLFGDEHGHSGFRRSRPRELHYSDTERRYF